MFTLESLKNKKQPEVKLELDGVTHTVPVKWNTLSDIKRLVGENYFVQTEFFKEQTNRAFNNYEVAKTKKLRADAYQLYQESAMYYSEATNELTINIVGKYKEIMSYLFGEELVAEIGELCDESKAELLMHVISQIPR